MDEFRNKHLYNNLTVKVRAKKIIPIRQIIIKKNGTNVKSIIPKPKYNNITYNNDESGILHTSEFLNTINQDEIQLKKDNINLSDFMNRTITTMNYNKALNKTIIKPVIFQQSVLKPIVMPINIRSSENLKDEYCIQKLLNSNSEINDSTNNTKIGINNKTDKTIHKNEIKNDNKENINPNYSGNTIRKRVIIQKSIKHKHIINNKKNENDIIKTKNIILMNPQPKEKDNVIIKKISQINFPKLRIDKGNKNNRLIPNLKEKDLFIAKFKSINKNIHKNDVMYKSQRLKGEENNKNKSFINNKEENLLRKSMRPIEKINNITVNNTLKQTYEDMIKHKSIIVSLNNNYENNKEIGPRDSIRFKNK